ncbi:MAG: zinc-dependent metalloprotease family protein [Myxococcota bacterium]
MSRPFADAVAQSRLARNGRLLPRLGLWLGVVALWMGIGLLPSTAEARGRRVVPDLRNPSEVSLHANRRMTTVGLTVHVASRDGVPVASRRQIVQWIERANEALDPFDIEVQLHRQVPMTGYTRVTRRKQRRQLASMAEYDGTIHVFVVESLDELRVAGLRRRVRGLHWRYRGLSREYRQREYVVVTLGAPRTTFAHEIGHLLGLRHSNDDRNIMCSCRRGSNLRFNEEQGAIMKVGVGRFLSRQQQAQARVQGQRRRNLDRARRRP